MTDTLDKILEEQGLKKSDVEKGIFRQMPCNNCARLAERVKELETENERLLCEIDRELTFIVDKCSSYAAQTILQARRIEKLKVVAEIAEEILNHDFLDEYGEYKSDYDWDRLEKALKKIGRIK